MGATLINGQPYDRNEYITDVMGKGEFQAVRTAKGYDFVGNGLTTVGLGETSVLPSADQLHPLGTSYAVVPALQRLLS